MDFTIYVPYQKTPPGKHKFQDAIDKILGSWVEHVAEHEFYDKTIRTSLGSLIKRVLEKTEVSSVGSREEINFACKELAQHTAQCFSYALQGKCDPLMFKVVVEVRWDGEVKTTVESCLLPIDFKTEIEFKFTTVGEVVNLPEGVYLALIPSMRDGRESLSYQILSVHPNVTFLGSMFIADYNRNLIVGYAPLDLHKHVQTLIEESGSDIWQRKS